MGVTETIMFVVILLTPSYDCSIATKYIIGKEPGTVLIDHKVVVGQHLLEDRFWLHHGSVAFSRDFPGNSPSCNDVIIDVISGVNRVWAGSPQVVYINPPNGSFIHTNHTQYRRQAITSARGITLLHVYTL